MLQYASHDIKSISLQQTQTSYDNAALILYGPEIVQTFKDKQIPTEQIQIHKPLERLLVSTDKSTHNFITEISTAIDNLYLTASNHYEIPEERIGDFKKHIRDQLKQRGHNKLAKLLSKKLGLSNKINHFVEIRNTNSHSTPSNKLTQSSSNFLFTKEKPLQTQITYTQDNEQITKPIHKFGEELLTHLCEQTEKIFEYILKNPNK